MQLSEELFLQEYDPSQFERPSVTVDILVMTVLERKLHLLLVRRSELPFLGKWALPGGFLKMDESAEEAATRIVLAKAGVSGAHLEQLYTFSSVERDPRTRVLSIAYLATVPYGKLKFAAGDSVDNASLYTVDGISGDGIDTGSEDAFASDESELVLTSPDGNEITGRDLAFDHEMIIRTAVLRMRGKIGYTDIAFRFLADMDSFSLSELQTVFEAVLGRKLDNSNFRRFIRNRYEETGRMVLTDREDKQGRGRPAALYQLKETGVKQR